MADTNVQEGPSSRLGTIRADGKRRWIHPIVSTGRFFRARAVLAYFLIVLYVGLPHLKIAGKPAFHIDLTTRQLHLFGTTFFATETIYLPFFGISLILSIALITALFGRVWCGWACPQTVYLEFIFRPIQSLFEGNASRRLRDETGKLTGSRIMRKAGKWLAYAVVAMVLGHSFVGYFAGPNVMNLNVLLHPLDNRTWFILSMAVSAAVLFDFGFFREQTCLIACPYGRIQSVFMDRRSLIVGYDKLRGEPRGKIGPKKQIADGNGDCIDCMACVRTCPTGIDIRHGLQMECIGCTQCIDACDPIMDKIGRPRGLIRYSSLDSLEGKTTSWIRARVFVYAAIVAVAASVGLYLLGSRSAFEFDVVRVTGSPYYVQSDGIVVNKLRLRITNRSDVEQTFTIDAPTPSGAHLVAAEMPIKVGARAVVPMEALVQLPKTSFVAGKSQAKLRVVSTNGTTLEQDFVLLGPFGGGS